MYMYTEEAIGEDYGYLEPETTGNENINRNQIYWPIRYVNQGMDQRDHYETLSGK